MKKIPFCLIVFFTLLILINFVLASSGYTNGYSNSINIISNSKQNTYSTNPDFMSALSKTVSSTIESDIKILKLFWKKINSIKLDLSPIPQIIESIKEGF